WLCRAGRDNKVTNRLQCHTVLLVVGRQRLLQSWIIRLLPSLSPNDALNTRRARMTPSTSQVFADVLQRVRVGREIDVPVDHGQHVDHPADKGLKGLPLSRRQAQSDLLQGHRLVAAIMEYCASAGERSDEFSEFPEQPSLSGFVVGPERVISD